MSEKVKTDKETWPRDYAPIQRSINQLTKKDNDMADDQIIEVLRKEGLEYREEIKGLKDIEDFRVSAIKNLIAENKALKEGLKTTQDIAFELTESLFKEGIELEKVEKIRDELLEAVSQSLKDKE